MVEIAEVYGRRSAHDVIARSRADYLEKFGDIARLAETIAWRGQAPATPMAGL
jgi:hypothetical protein